MANPFTTTLQVWRAIFLREALDRLFGMRAAWMWLLVEPAMHMAFMVFIRTVIRNRDMGGTDYILWLIVGILSFFLFRRTAVQAMHAVDCNKAFFAFRQVRPFDAAFVHAGVEAFILAFFSMLIVTVAAFMGHILRPYAPLSVLAALLGLWLFGLGYGLVASVIMRLVPEMSHILQILMMPLYILSGAIWPIASIPLPYRDWVMIIPLAHGLEVVRGGVLANYHTVSGTSLGYLYLWVLCTIFLGLALYRVFEMQLVMK